MITPLGSTLTLNYCVKLRLKSSFPKPKNGEDEVACHLVSTQELMEFLGWSSHLEPTMLKATENQQPLVSQPLEACFDLLIDETPTQLMSNFTWVNHAVKERSYK